jgi:hypothetical protein
LEVIEMTHAQIAVISIVVVAIVATAIVLVLRSRTKRLQAQFGPEYTRAVEETGSRYKAEAELAGLEKRVKRYSLQPLTSADRDRFQQSWRTIQANFIDDPGGALLEADQLLEKVMSARGYPPSDFQQRAAEISVDHATVVEHYRLGHEIALRHSERKATTEELRQAMIHYRALFDELMADATAPPLRARAVGRS